METTSMPSTSYSPQIFFENMAASPDNSSYLKLEDVHASSPSTSTTTTSHPQGSPDPIVVHSKPAKKRKSWGQQLPEPTTTLPPRKRAKTEDEKEQRRIERIKRNRAAAHNSRERKRRETDTLAVQLARAKAELAAYRNLHGPLPDSVVLPEVTLSTGTERADTPVPSLVGSRGSVDYTASPPSPAKLDDLFESEPEAKPTLAPQPDTTFCRNVVRPAVSVEEAQQPNFDFLVGESLPPYDGVPAPDDMQGYPSGMLESFPFTNGAFDSSFNAPLDFSFEDFLHQDDLSASVPADGGVGAA
ncbi:transcription factor that binds to CRE motif [Saxophila tyrrhenica]|uniref:Transcription factor that binds to CRE motif n=1 Tax=Saxophila tyrrhenica TaxID=1690608 RepID=A0AAV9PBV7_9PEZI|nr:transcription factor that binds to CRE motif [Saxophila tyrrhenica]